MHSDGEKGVFAATDAAELDGLFARPPRAWTRRGDRLSPSLAGPARHGHAGFALWQALWCDGMAAESPFLLLHTGCEAISPPGSSRLPFDDARYGRWAHGESILFYTAAVALVGRAKVFYDEPRGFAAALADGATIGDALRRYAELESAARTWGEVGGDIGRKRAYFWSLLGDGSLRLPRPSPN